jgi:hypothetical protein
MISSSNIVYAKGSKMPKYVLTSELYDPDFFEAKDDDEAEDYVDNTYSSDDGPLTLHKLTPILEWP